MYLLCGIALFAGSALARPDIGIPTGSYLPGGSSTNHFSNTQQYQQQQTQFGNQFNHQQGFTNHQQGLSNSFGNNQFGSTNTYSSQHVQHSAGAVRKNVYFYAAPEDDQPIQFRVRYQSGGGNKNHNIIFIKAPSTSIGQIPQISLANNHEEKTRIYVLVKKQEGSQEIVIPSASASAANKPEVYFIKYKTQSDAHQQIQAVQQGGSSGFKATDVGSGAQLVGSIRETQSHGHQEFHQESSSITNTAVNSNANQNNFGPAGLSGPYRK